MGSACAWVLARAGATVTVLERSVPGAEASSAAAGILGPHVEAHGPGPMVELMRASGLRHAVWARRLQQATGIDVGYRQCGVLKVSATAPAHRKAAADARWQQGPQHGVAIVSANQVRSLEPALGRTAGGVLYENDGRIEPPSFFRAVHIAARSAGAVFRTGAYVRQVVTRAGRAAGVALDDGTEIHAATVIVAAGSWTSLIGGTRLAPPAVIPARGQIVELANPAPLVQRLIFGPHCYLVPRDDGRVLVGSTLEFVGYQKDVTAGAVRDLLNAAIALVPALAGATLGRSWSNFRPYTPDELPIIGETDCPGLLLATGHYRTGILLAPITAESIAALAAGKKPPVSLEPFRAGRARIAPARDAEVAR